MAGTPAVEVPVTRTPVAGADGLVEASREAPGHIDAALADFDFRAATAALWRVVDEANRFVSQVRPWDLAKAERAGDERAAGTLDSVLALLVQTCQQVAAWLAPFLPDAAARLTRQCTAQDGRLPAPSPVFQRLTVTEGTETSAGTQATGTEAAAGAAAPASADAEPGVSYRPGEPLARR